MKWISNFKRNVEKTGTHFSAVNLPEKGMIKSLPIFYSTACFFMCLRELAPIYSFIVTLSETARLRRCSWSGIFFCMWSLLFVHIVVVDAQSSTACLAPV